MNKFQLLVAALILCVAASASASASVPIIKITPAENILSDSFSQKEKSDLTVDIAIKKAGTGSFNAVSGDYLAGMIGTNFSSVKSTYRQAVAKTPLFPMPETAMLALLVLVFVAIQSVGRKNKAGATKLQ
jgi:hypothetical protein